MAWDFSRLPKPDDFGNYYLSITSRAPAILVVSNEDSPDCGRYYPLPPWDERVPFRKGRILAYDTPEEALVELRKLTEAAAKRLKLQWRD